MLRQLARHTERPREAIGIDTSAAMLARVPALPPGWTTQQAGVRRLPVDDRSFDVAVASYVLHVLPPPNLPVAPAEVHRVLRPGGRLVTVTPVIPSRGAARALAVTADALARRGGHSI